MRKLNRNMSQNPHNQIHQNCSSVLLVKNFRTEKILQLLHCKSLNVFTETFI